MVGGHASPAGQPDLAGVHCALIAVVGGSEPKQNGVGHSNLSVGGEGLWAGGPQEGAEDARARTNDTQGTAPQLVLMGS